MNRPKLSCGYRSNSFYSYPALQLVSCRAAASPAAVPRTSLCILTRPSADSITASCAKRGALLAVVVYCTSRSKSDRDRSKCYCNSCYSEVFHIRSPLKLLMLVGTESTAGRFGENCNPQVYDWQILDCPISLNSSQLER